MQLSSSAVNVQKGRYSWQIDLPFVVLGLDLHETLLLVWTSDQMSIYQLSSSVSSNDKPVIVGHFRCSACSAARIHKSSCFYIEGASIEVRSLQGSSLAALSFIDSEGSPVLLDLCGSFLCAASRNGFVRVWNVTGRDPKLHVSTKQVAGSIGTFAAFGSLKINCDATCAAFTVHAADGGQLNKLFIWRMSSSVVDEYDFSGEFHDRQLIGSNWHWDEEESRIVLCQLAGLSKNTLVSIFVSDESQELLVQDALDFDGSDATLVGVFIPKYVVLDQSARMHVRQLDSLASLDEHNDKSTRDALISFNCHLRRGRVEQAYQVVRSLNRSVVQFRNSFPSYSLIY